MLSTPRELGREAFSQAHSGRAPLVRASHIVLLNTEVDWWARTQGKNYFRGNRGESFENPQSQLSLARITYTFSTLFSTEVCRIEGGYGSASNIEGVLNT